MNEVQTFSGTRIGEIMTRSVQTLGLSDSISDAARLMIDENYSTVPVVSQNGECLGILSRSDLTEMFLLEDRELSRMLDTRSSFAQLCSSFVDTCNEKCVRELMTYDVFSVLESVTVAEACKLMYQHQIHHLPVVDELNKVVGIVSSFDIVDAVAHGKC